MSQQLPQVFSHESNIKRDTTEELSHEELTTITGGNASQDAQKGAIGGAILGVGSGAILGAIKSPRFGIARLGGAVGGAVVGGAVDAGLGAAFAPLGGAILKNKSHH